VPSGRLVNKFPHPDYVSGVALSSSGDLLITACGSSSRIWNIPSGQLLRRLDHSKAANKVFISPNDALAITTTGNTAHLWSVRSCRVIGPALTHSRDIACAAFSPDSRFALTGSEDGSMRLWDSESGTQIGPAILISAEVRGACFLPEGKTFLVLSEGRIKAFNVPTPSDDDADQVQLWAEVTTGVELDSRKQVHVLTRGRWKQRKAQLETIRSATR
jgi:WD40 repeat protein